MRKDAKGQGRVDERSERRKESIELFQEKGRNRIGIMTAAMMMNCIRHRASETGLLKKYPGGNR